jgi:hypothetical protein
VCSHNLFEFGIDLPFVLIYQEFPDFDVTFLIKKPFLILTYIVLIFEINEISKTVSNYLISFGGVNRSKHGENVFNHLKNELDQDIEGNGCPAHILSNAIHFGAEQLFV